MNAHHAHFNRLSESLTSIGMELNADEIQKLRKATIPDLIAKATLRFNRFIRIRDSKDGYFTCISCGKILPVKQMNAGHYYSAGGYPPLRFNENNANGQCGFHCNKMLSGNLIEYRKGLIRKIGEDGVRGLDLIAEDYKRNGWKWDKISLLEIIKKYEAYK